MLSVHLAFLLLFFSSNFAVLLFCVYVVCAYCFGLEGGPRTFFSQIIHIYIHELLRYTEDSCCWFHFLVVGVCVYNTRRIKSLKTTVSLLSCTMITQARIRGRGKGGGGA